MLSNKIAKKVFLILDETQSRKQGTKYLEFVFNNYSEARRTAQNIVRNRNSIEDNVCPKMREIIPDCWSNAKMTIEIVAVDMKEIAVPKKDRDYVLNRGTIIVSNKKPSVFKMHLHLSS